MGFFDSIGDALSDGWDAISGGVGDVFDFAKDTVGGLFGFNQADLGGSALDMLTKYGSGWLENSYINQPNTAMTYEMNKEAATKAFKRSRHLYKHRYQWMADDLAKAGINPILAASSGLSTSGTPSVASAQAYQTPAPKMAADFANSALTARRAEKTSQESKEIETRAKHNLQKVVESVAATINQRAQANKASAEEKTAGALMFKYEQEVRQLSENIEKIKADTALSEQQRKTAIAEMDKLQRAANLLRMQAKKLEKTSNVYEGKIGQILAYISEILGAARVNLGLIGGFRR
jgi:putative heme iron utilization protein